MKPWTRLVLCGLTCALAAVPASAVSGVIPERSTAAGIVDVIESNWNVNEFDCLRVLGKGAAAGFSTALPAGTSIVSLPRKVTSPAIAGAADLFAALGGTAVVNSIGKYDTATDTLNVWDGKTCSARETGCPDPCFCIDTEAGHGFHVNLASATVLALNGHDGALRIELTGANSPPPAPPSASGTHQIALPLATPLTTAAALLTSIDLQAMAPAGTTVGVSVQALLPDNTLVTYQSGDPVNDFALTPGLGYRVQVAESVVYTPPFVDSGQGPVLLITARNGPCVGRRLSLTFDVPGGETTAPIAFDLAIACSAASTLTAALGINGGPPRNIADGTVDFGPFGTTGSESMIAGQVVPTLGEWAQIVFAILLLTVGVILILRSPG